jgi:hypothetical protein
VVWIFSIGVWLHPRSGKYSNFAGVLRESKSNGCSYIPIKCKLPKWSLGVKGRALGALERWVGFLILGCGCMCVLESTQILRGF